MKDGAIWPPSVEAINDLPEPKKAAIYHQLIPEWVYDRYGIERETFRVRGRSVLALRCPSGSIGMELTVLPDPDAQDPLLYINLADSSTNQLEVLLLIVNDPTSPRFNTDALPDGTPTKLGTAARNIPEEVRAMQYGLTPGQVRSGLRVFRAEVPRFEQFVRNMGHDLFLLAPLAYHNAITFERYGFSYLRGRKAMEAIHDGFLPGGEFHARLDGSTPFRHPDAWRTVRGRSWAIHDGILGQRFDGIQMYKRIGSEAHINTFPDSIW